MKKFMRIVLVVTFFIYCLVVLSILFLNNRWGRTYMTLLEYIRFNSNLIPFKTILGYIRAFKEGSMNLDIPIKNIFGNLFLFLPMGLYLPCLFKKLASFGKFILSILAILIAVEILQLFLRRGVFDIDDLILNILGAIIGFGIWKIKIMQNLLRKLYLIK